MKTKKRLIKSIESLSKELTKLIHEQYPLGYEEHITRIKNAKNESIFVFPVETPEATYLIKIPAIKNSEGEYEMEEEKEREDNSSSLSQDDYDNDIVDDDSDENIGVRGKKGNTEASYDPDFD